ncbi:phospholipase A2 [Streptomyces sp. NPDC059009]|uniref:phospholipase A2 n=1 Tax=Streptomyces sp. NPDC059009 TaxID=3346694 RepID=UPI00368D8E3C
MLTTRITVASLAVAGVLATGSGAVATAAPESGHTVTASAEAAKAPSPAKMKRLYTLTRSSKTSLKDWRQTRKLAKAGIDRWNFRWDTDWCTKLVDQPGGFDFRLSCARHDFGYRNYKTLIGKKAFAGSKHEKRVDKAFYFDMLQQCKVEPNKTSAQREKCRATAKKYYKRVS